MKERWAAIPSAVGYEASTLGRVRSLDRTITDSRGRRRRRRGQILRPTLIEGYYRVSVAGRSRRKVAHLVLEAFVGPRPPGMFACHGPAGSTVDLLTNLRWDTPSANSRDAVTDGTHSRARRTACPLAHLLIEPNLVVKLWREHRYRNCLACTRARGYCIAHPDLDVREVADRYYRSIMEERHA